MPVKRRLLKSSKSVGRPSRRSKPLRSRRPARRRRMQKGGQLGALLPLIKFLGPLVLGEAAKFGIQTGLRKIRGKGIHSSGRGLHLAGAGLRLAGQGRRRKPGPKRVRMQVIR